MTRAGLWFAFSGACLGGALWASVFLPQAGVVSVSSPHRLPAAAATLDEPAAHADAAPRASAPPVRIRIPAIGVDAPVGTVGLDRSGRLAPPTTVTATGWWRGGPRPGEAGPAVIVGHLDSRTGPAVFGGLSMLRPGDAVSVSRADGSTAVFIVRRVALFPKARFPTTAVYGPTRDAELRLITCGGEYDRSADTYLGNVVAFADLSSTVRSSPRAPGRRGGR